MAKIYQDPGAISNITEILSLENPSSVLLVRGNKSYETSRARDAIEAYSSGYKITSISGFRLFPTLKDIEVTLSVARKEKVDFVIGIGGGTVMDIAKAAAVLCNEKGSSEAVIRGEQELQNPSVKKLLIPTTSGPGAEVTPRSTIYINQEKKSLSHPNMAPDYIILAPELTYNMSPLVTAQTGCDALAQAIEGFWSAKATEDTKQYSRIAIKVILENLAQAVNRPTPDSRDAMMFGSHMAGKSILDANTTAAHALSYPMTSDKDIPHGHAAMLSLPYFLALTEELTEEKVQEGLTLTYVNETFQELFSLMKVKNGIEARDKLLNLMDEIHLTRRLHDFGIKGKDLGKLADKGYLPARLENHPIIITKKDLEKILEDIF